ncbi:polysaccharide pyruvyl transferase family protein [Clostridium baratii]|uniref:polysaccharide pyruvyl transferase family protein n=1 Tax=Clostridium baratii TaxID=1561 RepID=UPI0030D36A6F
MRYIKEYIKRILSFIKINFGNKERIINYEKKNIYIFLAADYRNMGDVAITYAQKNFLKDYFSDFNIIEIPAEKTISYIYDIKKHIKKDDIITLVGGGNMGNIYEYYENLRRLVIRTFKNNMIISFPQTIDFTNDKDGEFSMTLSSKVISNHKNIVIFAREENSYNIMKNTFECPVFLAPDIVLYLINDKKIINNNIRKNVGACFRNDKEKSKLSLEITNSIINNISNIEYFTTYLDEDKFKYDKRYDILISLIKRISTFDYVITDRLHAMIFSFLTNTRCYFIDNSNNKISQTKKTWLSKSNNIIEIKNKEDIRCIVNKKEKNGEEILLNLNNEFEKMKNIIISYYRGKEVKNG